MLLTPWHTDAFDMFDSPWKKLMEPVHDMPGVVHYRSESAPLSQGAHVSRLDDGSLQIEVSLPGLSKKDVAVEVKGDTLTIQTQFDEQASNSRYTKSFSQAWRLRGEHDADAISATMKNGILFVTVPKQEKEVRKISIK